MSKWSIFLNNTRYCTSQRGTGCRPCDRGVPCDRCHFDTELNQRFEAEKDSIDESLYCSYCDHELNSYETDGVCEVCHEENDDYY